ncbi:MAG: hypothetical protein FK733_00505 [Asgard group archaeon]|nr:hypothetical protein [Asgard group archaeon]
MKKKIFYAMLIISLILVLPAFSGTAAVAPDDIDTSTTPDAVYNYDGNTIEIIEQTPESTLILLNDTYQLDLTHNSSDVGVKATKLDLTPGLTTEADEELFDVNFKTDSEGQHLDIDLPDFSIDLDISGPNSDKFDGTITGMEMVDFSYNSTSGDFSVYDGTHLIEFDAGTLIVNGGAGPLGFLISRVNSSAWDIITPLGIVLVNYRPGMNLLGIDFMMTPLYYGVIPTGAGMLLPPPLSIYFFENGVGIEWAGATIYIHNYMVVIIFDYITITWYFGFIIEHLVILIWDLTIIIYLTIVELLIVIIYSTFEIKIYEYQMVIVYQYIEIIILFVSVVIWEFTFIFHFEFWFIEIIYIVDIVINIIVQPIRFVFIPVIIPVFIPVIFFVPVLIINFIHIYVPYASPALHIDVYYEDLQMPTHTVQYFVYDETGNAVNDATVSVNYNGTDYPATFVANGVYQVLLPASIESETITVTASKSWYPDALLVYDLEVDWIIETITLPPTNVTVTETETPTAPLYILPIVSALALIAATTILVRRKKK